MQMDPWGGGQEGYWSSNPILPIFLKPHAFHDFARLTGSRKVWERLDFGFSLLDWERQQMLGQSERSKADCRENGRETGLSGPGEACPERASGSLLTGYALSEGGEDQ